MDNKEEKVYKRAVKGFSAQCVVGKNEYTKATIFFTLKERQKTVTCNMVMHGGDQRTFIGVAKCDNEDEFNLDIGMNIALKKACTKYRAYMDTIADKYAKKIEKASHELCEAVVRRHCKMIRKGQYKLRP